MNATEFEKRVEQISALLEEPGVEVTWNDKILDPDNRDQTRQIDVSIRRGDDLTLVECRHHKRPQDVKWIEELYGRKASLRASQIIGVSSSGFTEGAIKKAKSLGVFIRTLSEVSDSEVRLWGCRSTVTLTYAELFDLKIYFVCGHFLQAPITPKLVQRAFRGVSLGSLLATAVRDVARSNLGQGPIVSRVQEAQGVFLGSVPIHELFLCFSWRAIERQQVLPVLMSYGDIHETEVDNVADMEASPHSRTAVVYSNGQVNVVVDASVMSFAPGSVLTGARVEFTTPVQARMLGIIGLKDEEAEGLYTEFLALPQSSPTYAWLVQSSTGPNSWHREI